MIIVGGTYTEICFEPIWENVYGSGFRAVNLILNNNKGVKIDFYTCADQELKEYLDYFSRISPNLTIHTTEIDKSPEFYYDHPLKVPVIIPRPDLFNDTDRILDVTGQNILVFGLIESLSKVHGSKVVYDPQSPANPKAFSNSGSSAEELIYIINFSEAKKVSNSKELHEIVKYFFDKEKCKCLIIKMGAKGALLYQDSDSIPVEIPVYITNNVWPIGSGDVFSSFFALKWFNGEDIITSAKMASMATAHYCNSKNLTIPKLENSNFKELTIQKKPEGKVYLAGPFFTYAERWLVNEIWNTLKEIGLNVFSPFHDVGHGKAEDVVSKDLEGLNESEIVFAIVDGLDSGTLFEIGYAVARNIKVIAFVQKEGEEELKMLEGTNCFIEKDLTTAIYKLYWELAKK